MEGRPAENGKKATVAGKRAIELQENYAVLSLPKKAVEISLMAKVYHGGKIITVERMLLLEDIQEAFKSAEDDYFTPDDIWSLSGSYDERGKQ